MNSFFKIVSIVLLVSVSSAALATDNTTPFFHSLYEQGKGGTKTHEIYQQTCHINNIGPSSVNGGFFPKVPILHPGQLGNNRAPNIPLVAHFGPEARKRLPVSIQKQLIATGIQDENLRIFLVVQNLPWIEGGPIQLWPQYGIEYPAPENKTGGLYVMNRDIQAGIFSHYPSKHIGQLNPYTVSTSNHAPEVDSRTVISGCLPINGAKSAEHGSFWSQVNFQDANTAQSIVTLHLQATDHQINALQNILDQLFADKKSQFPDREGVSNDQLEYLLYLMHNDESFNEDMRQLNILTSLFTNDVQGLALKWSKLGLNYLKNDRTIAEWALQIKEANPLMSEDLAAAWAKLTRGDPYLLNRALTRIDQNKALGVQGNADLQLYFQARPGDGDCGYHSMDITRAQAYERLSANLNRQDIQEMIAAELMQAVTQNELSPDLMTEELQILFDMRIGNEAARAILNGEIREEHGIGENDDINLQFLLEANILSDDHRIRLATQNATEDHIITQLDAWCKNEVNMRAYIKSEIASHNWLSFTPHQNGIEGGKSIIDALATLDNVNLVIYSLSDNGQTLIERHRHMVNGAAATRHLLYSGGAQGHYDRLFEVPTPLVPAGIVDPYAFLDKEIPELSGLAYKLIADEGLAWNERLDPEIAPLERDVFNWEADETKNLYIEQLGRAEYVRRLAEMKANIVRRKAILEEKKSNWSLADHLRRTLVKKGIMLESQINAAIAIFGLEPIATVIKPEKLAETIPDNVDDIIQGLGENYLIIEVRADGLYATKQRELPLELVYPFAVDVEGVQKYYTRTPDAKEIEIYDEMLAWLKENGLIKSNPSYHENDQQKTVAFGKYLFEQRTKILKEAENGRYDDLTHGGRYLHTSYSNPKTYSYDHVVIEQRLNNIHNSIVQPYLVAKKRGRLEHLFKNAFVGGYCIDGISRTLHDYAKKQEQNLDNDKNFHLLTKQKALDTYFQTEIYGKVDSAAEATIAFTKNFLGTKTTDGFITQQDIDEYVQHADKVLNLF